MTRVQVPMPSARCMSLLLVRRGQRLVNRLVSKGSKRLEITWGCPKSYFGNGSISDLSIALHKWIRVLDVRETSRSRRNARADSPRGGDS